MLTRARVAGSPLRGVGLALRTPRPLRWAGGRGPGCAVASEVAGVAYALRNRDPKKKKNKTKQQVQAFDSTFFTLQSAFDEPGGILYLADISRMIQQMTT